MRWSIAFLSLGLLALPVGATTQGETKVLIPLTVYIDGSVAPETSARIPDRIAFVNDALRPAGLELVLGAIRPSPWTSASACDGSDALLSRIIQQGVSAGEITLAVHAHDGSPSLGCAMQDAYGTRFAAAALMDPPYDSAPLGGTDTLRDLHANLLYAHELGHVLGGRHEWSSPQGYVEGVSGTIMYPTLQINVPKYSGEMSHGTCVAFGNICAMHDHAAQAGITIQNPSEQKSGAWLEATYDKAERAYPSSHRVSGVHEIDSLRELVAFDICLRCTEGS